MAKSSMPNRRTSNGSADERLNPFAAAVYAIIGLAVAWWLAKRVFGFVLFWIKFGVLIAIVGGLWWLVRKFSNKSR